MRGLISLEGGMVFDSLLSELEAIGYEVWTLLLPACAQNAPHRRDRVWIVAHYEKQVDGGYNAGEDKRQIQQLGISFSKTDVADTQKTVRRGPDRTKNSGRWDSETGGQGEPSRGIQHGPTQSSLGDTLNGLPGWLVRAWGTGEWEEGIPRVATGVKDRVNKLKALGNAILPQVVMPIMQAIKEIDKNDP